MTSYQLATAKEATPVKKKGELFYEATTFDIVVGSSATNMTLSSNSDGTGEIFADDVVKIIATTTDSPTPILTANYSHDYSNNCIGYVRKNPPVNLFDTDGFSALKGREIKVEIQFFDQCGTSKSGTAYFLSIS